MFLLKQLRATPQEIKNLPKSVKQVTLVIFIYYISWGLIIPFLPLFFFDVLGSYSAVTFVSALVTLFALAWLFPIGKFLDNYSQRKILRLSLLLYLPIWPILAVIRVMWHAVLYQMYHSIISAMFWSSADTYNRSHAQRGKQSEAWGLYDVGKALSLIIGAVIGGLLLEHVMDIRTMLWVFPPIFVIGAYIVSERMPKDPLKMDLKATTAFKLIDWKGLYLRSVKDFYNVPGLFKIWPFIFLIGFLLYSQLIMIPLLAESAGASYLIIGLIFALFNVPMLLEAPFSVLADTWSSRRLITFGFTLAGVSLLSFGLNQDILVLLPLSLLLGLATAMLAPTISGAVGRKIEPKQVGELNSVFTFSQSLGGVVGLLILGPLADSIGIQNIFFITAAVMFFSAIWARAVWDRDVILTEKDLTKRTSSIYLSNVKK